MFTDAMLMELRSERSISKMSRGKGEEAMEFDGMKEKREK